MAKVRFEWEPKKDRTNQGKHGVSFAKAQLAFADPKRVVAEDLSHSSMRSAITASGGSKAGPLHVPRGRDPDLRGRLLAKGQANL